MQPATTAGLKRFGYMRFYVPSDQLPDIPGFWDQWFSSQTEKAQVRALAFYLFNMYVTTNSYAQLRPSELTLNDTGVLDALMLCEKPIDYKQSVRFYQAHFKEVHDWLQVFFAGHNFPWPKPAESDYAYWVKLLEKQPSYQKQIVYRQPTNLLLQAPIPAEVTARLTPFLTKAQMRGKQQVVLYDEPNLQLEDFDNKIRSPHLRRKRTYRWVNEECNFSSYLTARLLTADIVQHRNQWGFIRVYQITVYPSQEEFLRPAQGKRFVLADGKLGLSWRYHTATLVVVPHNKTYIPVVLDSFLGGTQPLSMNQWLKQFGSKTVFKVVPFRRSEVTEHALRVPQKLEGTSVWVDGNKYTPAEVIE
ncbi:MAG: hypothetical protein IJ876_05350 [Elusimicrobiaceae bacterium]|nr:hypothetical protein [Elusimicrobiaceae bacterium]